MINKIMLRQLNYPELELFCLKIRRIAFESTLKVNSKKKKFVSPAEEVIESVITLKEVKTLLIDEFSLDTTDEYVVLDNDHSVCQLMLESVISRLINNELNIMVNEGVLECYFDNDSNDFLFKMKE
jgi:hypothetical protein